MKILMTLEGEFPPDTRVEKEALSLISEGHQVYIACYTIDKSKPLKEEFRGITIYRKRLNRFLLKLSAASLIIPTYFKFWKRFIKELYRELSFDVIHVHDLPLTKVALYFKRKHNIKLVCDQHEFYSDWIVHAAHLNVGTGKIIKFLSNWKNYETKYLPKADLIITIEPPLKDIYASHYHIDRSKIITLPNTPERSVFNKDNIDHSIKEKYKNDFVLLYIGGINILRGFGTILKALPAISESIPHIKFVFAGKMYKNCNPLEDAKKLGVDKYVEYAGFLDYRLMPSYISASDICVHVPPVIRQENNTTIASKVYQYAALEKPIIAGQGRLLKSFVESNKIGFSIKEQDHADLANKVVKIYKNPEILKEIKENYKELSGKFFWENTVETLLTAYKNL